MADISTRPYSPNYSGLINQAGFGGFLLALCWTGYELMRSARRHRGRENGWGWKWKEPLGSVESWEFGYLYQARCWSLRPSIRLPRWSLAWIKQVLQTPEDHLSQSIGLDQTLYIRFLRGCWWYMLLHTFTTLPILLPINVTLTPVSEQNPERSMTRASLSQLISTSQGISLLWIHQLALYWLFVTWLVLLWWLSRGLWRWRERAILRAKRAIEQGISVLSSLPPPSQAQGVSKRRRGTKERSATSHIAHLQEGEQQSDLESSKHNIKGTPLPPSTYNTQHPLYSSQPAYPSLHALHPLPPSSHPHTPNAPLPTSPSDRGLRLRTVMVSNVPVGMRSEGDLKEYFEYYMCGRREVLSHVPPISPGFLPRVFNWFMHRRVVAGVAVRWVWRGKGGDGHIRSGGGGDGGGGGASTPNIPRPSSNPATLAHLEFGIIDSRPSQDPQDPQDQDRDPQDSQDSHAPPPIIERVVICRKMTELASRVERREEYLRRLEACHVRLARRALEGVREFMERGRGRGGAGGAGGADGAGASGAGGVPVPPPVVEGREGDVERGVAPVATGNTASGGEEEGEEEFEDDEAFDAEKEQARMEVLVKELGPFVREFYPDMRPSSNNNNSRLKNNLGAPMNLFRSWRSRAGRAGGDGYGRVSREGSDESGGGGGGTTYPPLGPSNGKQDPTFTPPTINQVSSSGSGEGGGEGDNELQKKTIWHALHALPRSYLDPYQPLVSLHTLFRGATAPAIDYYHSKVGFLTGLIQESRTVPQRDLRPTSTAFVTFHSPEDARRCVRYLPNHPDNILACIVEPAPDWRDLDWHRIGRSTFTGEFVRDWIVKLGVWAFTLFWIIPVSALVALISVDKISSFFPVLSEYLDHHSYQKEVITAFIPTLLVAILAILVPLLLLLIAKQAHTILTLSRLHDTIMTRYYKFLVCNVLVFFCLGTTTLNAILDSIRQNPGGDVDDSKDFVKIIATSFPNAAPFYVGWLVFQTAMHSGLELGLYGLPLFVYPSTRGSTTLRRREVGIRPRTYNFYYWVPNHIMVLLIVIIFTVLNPLVVPFALIYFSAATIVHKNQLMRVYAKWYDQNGTVILVRILRYTLDGFIFAEIVFLALNALTRRSNPGQNVVVLTTNMGLTGVLLVITTAIKIYFTTVLRAKFDELDKKEAAVYHNPQQIAAERGVDLPDQASSPRDYDPLPETKEESEIQEQDEDTSPKTKEAEFHPGSVRLWNWKLPTDDRFPYRTLPDQVVGPSNPRGAIPFETGQEGAEGLDRKLSVTSSTRNSPPTHQRRWSVGAVGAGGVGFPKELSDVLESLESPTTPNNPTSTTSVAPLISQAEALNHARLSLERGEETTIMPPIDVAGLDSHGRGRPGPGRATISFDTPPVILREKKKSTASSSAKSAGAKSTGSHKGSYVELPASLRYFRTQGMSPDPNSIPLIRPHPKTGPWDDSPRYDIPFQNPAYVCPIDDFLWLPRNPCAKLNLDDSIEMRKAIRTEAHLGGLGEWIDDGTSVDVIPRNTVDSHAAVPGTMADVDALTIASAEDAASEISHDEAGGIPLTRQATTKSSSSAYTRRLLNGMEHIHLPPGIRARIPRKAADEFGFKRRKLTTPSVVAQKDEEIEPSEGAEMMQDGYFTIRAKPSISRPGWPSHMGRSFSKQSASSVQPKGEGQVSTSTLGIQRRTSSRSVFSRHSTISRTSTTADVTEDPALQPDISAQSPFADPDLSIVITRSSMVASSPPPFMAEEVRRTNSMFATGGVNDQGHLAVEVGRGQGLGLGTTAPDSGSMQEVGMGRRRSQAGRSVSSRTRSSRAGSVSVRDAIVGEVLAEEQIATAKRVKEEMDEAERVAGPRSYWTGWMWRQVSNNNPLPPTSSGMGRTTSRREPQVRSAVGDAGPPSAS